MTEQQTLDAIEAKTEVILALDASEDASQPNPHGFILRMSKPANCIVRVVKPGRGEQAGDEMDVGYAGLRVVQQDYLGRPLD
jgi:hypothetical protein